MKTFNNNKITFKFPSVWEVEKVNIQNNSDCVATVAKGETNLLNVVQFPTATTIEEFKPHMEDMFTEDGGVILSSEIIEIASKQAIYMHGNIDTVEINFDIHSFVFIENKNIYFFEFRTLDVTNETIEEFKNIVNTFEILK